MKNSLAEWLGAGLATCLSWYINHSFWWAVFHFICGWFYVIYWICKYYIK